MQLLLGVALVATMVQPAQADPAFTVVDSPEVSQYSTYSAIVAPDDQHAYAVGREHGKSQPLAVSWNGKSWQVEKVEGVESGALNAVSVDRNGDAWAVGARYTGGGNGGLAVHRQGGKWVPLPEMTGDKRLRSVSATAPDNVWVVGNNNEYQPLAGLMFAWHWDGHSWTEHQIPVRTEGKMGSLHSVIAVGPNDVYVFGDVGPGPPPYSAPDSRIVEHWDGRQWTRVLAPREVELGYRDKTVTATTGTGPTDLWLVHRRSRKSMPSDDKEPVVVRGDGTTWTETVVPVEQETQATGLAVDQQGHAWFTRTGVVRDARPKPLVVMRWDGTQWANVKVPAGISADSTFYDPEPTDYIATSPSGKTTWVIAEDAESRPVFLRG